MEERAIKFRRRGWVGGGKVSEGRLCASPPRLMYGRVYLAPFTSGWVERRHFSMIYSRVEASLRDPTASEWSRKNRRSRRLRNALRLLMYVFEAIHFFSHHCLLFYIESIKRGGLPISKPEWIKRVARSREREREIQFPRNNLNNIWEI